MPTSTSTSLKLSPKSIFSHLLQFSLSWLHCTASALFDRLDRLLCWLLGISPQLVRELDQISRDRDEFYEICLSEIPEQGQWKELVAIEKVERGIFATEEKQVVDYVAKDSQHYAFVYTHSTKGAVLRMVGDFAKDAAHPLNWHDAAHITRMIREHDIQTQWYNAKHGPS